MRLSRALPAIPVGLVALLLATAVPAGAIPVCTTGCQIFGETGSPQALTVPAGVLGVTVDLVGAGGGSGYDMANETQLAGAHGGLLIGTLATTPGSTLEVVVGQTAGNGTSTADGAGGYNGGGDGAYYSGGEDAFGGGGGGGATDIRTGSCATTLSCGDAARVAIAGGGGGTGGGSVTASAGGDGGGASGVDGTAADGTVGGGGGAAGGPGAGGGGGSTGVGDTGGAGSNGGGGGGGGYYGGGGGGLSADDDGTGGGGGGGYILDPTAADYSEAGAGAPGDTSGSATIYWPGATSLSVVAGGSVTITAYVPFFEDGGTETFTFGSTTLCSDVTVADGEASCTTSALPIGTDDVTATLSATAPVSFRVPGSVTLDSHLGSGSAPATATPDATAPWDGTTEVLAVSVASAVPVPESGAGVPAGVPPLAALLILVGAAGIVTTRRRRRAA
jgi:hypothetical protein